MAMVTGVTGFIMIFKDIGLSAATIQREEINHEQISTLFWINVAASLVLAILTILVAPLLSWFFGREELTAMTIWLGCTFLFAGITAQHQALLQRQMRFGTLALIEVGSRFLGAVAAIAAALNGWSYWALVVQQMVSVIVTTCCVWTVLRWTPSLPTRRSGVKAMVAFGGNLAGFRILNYFSRNADNFLIGWYWGAHSLGVYSKAYALLLLPITQVNLPITSVAIPTLSRLFSDPDRYRRYVIRELNVMMWLTCPIIAISIGLAEDVVRFALGPQWMEAVPVFRLLGLSAFFQVVYSMTGQIFISANQTDRQLRWGLVAAPLFIISFVIGLPYGVTGVAISYSIMFLLFLPWTLSYTLKNTPLSSWDFYSAMLTPLMVGLVLMAVIWGTAKQLSDAGIVTRIAACLAAASFAFAVMFLVFATVKKEVLLASGLLTDLIRRKKHA